MNIGEEMGIVAGDVVNRGPRPAACLRVVLEKQRSKGWLLLRGNHEEYVLTHAAETQGGIEAEIFKNSRWTFEQLGGAVTALESWPFSLSLAMDHGELRAAHASMRHNRDGIYIDTPDETLREQIGARPPGVFVVGHTHKPLVRRVDLTTVINVGAVGLPFDGDPRAGYAQVEHLNGVWQAELVRLDYDRTQADRDFVESGFMDNAGAMARLIRVELRIARSQIAEWVDAYEAQVRAGEIGLAESVTRFLETEGLVEQ